MDLPTISVTNAQAAKLIELFGSAAEYKQWLRQAVREEALRRHAQTLRDQANTAVREGLEALESELPGEGENS